MKLAHKQNVIRIQGNITPIRKRKRPNSLAYLFAYGAAALDWIADNPRLFVTRALELLIIVSFALLIPWLAVALSLP